MKIILELIDLNSLVKTEQRRGDKKQRDLRLDQPEDVRLCTIKKAVFSDSFSDMYWINN